MKIQFAENRWNLDGLTYAYTLRYPKTKDFIQKEHCIETPANPESLGGYDYVTLIAEEKYTPGTKITAECSFEGDGAPLIVLVRDLTEKDGDFYYGDSMEVVLWKNGLNVWNLWMQEDGTVTWEQLLGLTVPMTSGTVHKLSVKICKDRFLISLDDLEVSLQSKEIYSSFYPGIIGCEGICRVYNMEIEQQ